MAPNRSPVPFDEIEARRGVYVSASSNMYSSSPIPPKRSPKSPIRVAQAQTSTISPDRDHLSPPHEGSHSPNTRHTGFESPRGGGSMVEIPSSSSHPHCPVKLPSLFKTHSEVLKTIKDLPRERLDGSTGERDSLPVRHMQPGFQKLARLMNREVYRTKLNNDVDVVHTGIISEPHGPTSYYHESEHIAGRNQIVKIEQKESVQSLYNSIEYSGSPYTSPPPPTHPRTSSPTPVHYSPDSTEHHNSPSFSSPSLSIHQHNHHSMHEGSELQYTSSSSSPPYSPLHPQLPVVENPFPNRSQPVKSSPTSLYSSNGEVSGEAAPVETSSGNLYAVIDKIIIGEIRYNM